MPELKICGVTNEEDARLIGGSGAHYLGVLVDVGFSERSLTLTRAREVASATGVPVVVLLCDPSLDKVAEVWQCIKPHAIQFQCHESPEFIASARTRVDCQIWKAIHLPILESQASLQAYIAAGVDAVLVDSIDTSEGFARMGGTGKVADWQAAAEIVQESSVPVFLAGGINPDNVQKAIRQVRPHGIDLCSGVEAKKGKKDPAKVRALVKAVRAGIPADTRGET